MAGNAACGFGGKRRRHSYLIILAGVLCMAQLVSCGEKPRQPAKDARVSWAGVRSSSYGIKPFPKADEWISVAGEMEAKYPGSVGSYVWIVGTVSGNRTKYSCTLNFPLDEKIEGVNPFPVDQNEDFLDMCDRMGYAVWLQVEPGDCDLPALAAATMRRYKHHPSVRGFGVDVEWFHPAGTDGYGVAITDDLAAEIDRAVKGVDKRYNFFLKHWDADWMPPTYRSDIVFVNDSQGHYSLESMKEEFAAWTEAFHPNPVMFQIGYEADEDLWKTLDDPARDLGEFLSGGLPIGQKIGIIWVDFTLRKVSSSL